MDIYTTEDIELSCKARFPVRQYLIIPNVFWGFFINREADLLIISKSGYVTEIEIKISFADFKKDFTKKCVSSDIYENDSRIKSKIYAMPESVYDQNKEKIMNLLPAYAGLWLNGEYGIRRIIKKPVNKKNARKLTDKEIMGLMRLGCMRIWNLKHTLHKINVEKRNSEVIYELWFDNVKIYEGSLMQMDNKALELQKSGSESKFKIMKRSRILVTEIKPMK